MKSSKPVLLMACLTVLGGQAPLPPAAGAAADAARACPTTTAPTERSRLTDWISAVQSGSKVDVLAVGSQAMLGPRGTAEGAFTARAVRAIQAAYPAVGINLVVRNARGALASDMLHVLQTELAAHRYPLILWQAGTVEAAHNVPPAELSATLLEGARSAAQSRSSLILIDMQYSRLLQAQNDLAPFEAAIAEVAQRPGVALFHRYDLTREWVTSGRIDLERAAPAERQPTADLLNECLAKALAAVADPRP